MIRRSKKKKIHCTAVSMEKREHVGLCNAVVKFLKRNPGAYATNYTLLHRLRAWGEGVGENPATETIKNIEVWFRTEKGRKNALEREASTRLPHEISAIHEEVGEPGETLATHYGYTVACEWVEWDADMNTLVVCETERARKDRLLKRYRSTNPDRALQDTLSASISVYTGKGGIADLNIERDTRRAIADSVKSIAFGTPMTDQVYAYFAENPQSLFYDQGVYGLPFLAVTRLADITQHLTEEVSSIVWVNAIKRMIAGASGDGAMEILDASSEARKELSEKLSEWGYDSLCSRAEKILETATPITTEVVSAVPRIKNLDIALNMEILYEILSNCKDYDEAQNVITFIEGACDLPASHAPSMWDIYTSWKNGCEHWELGPALAPNFIDTDTASPDRPPHEQCREMASSMHLT